MRVEWKGEPFTLTYRGKLGWSIGAGDADYLIGPDPEPRAFFRNRGLSALRSGRPQRIASARYPLLLVVDRVTVHAWPGFVPRGTGATTYVNPKTGDRVATVKDHTYWLFATAKRDASACGTTDPEQTVDDITDLARIWLRAGLD